jgi:hypothetical protein
MQEKARLQGFEPLFSMKLIIPFIDKKYLEYSTGEFDSIVPFC